ncbi:ATP-binding protein [bacterium]|nr:MAG: ATP-binding protein [bacterium]
MALSQFWSDGRKATQECPCGYHGDPNNACSCAAPVIQRYMAKVSGPLLDRIDIHIECPAIKYNELAGEASGEKSSVIRDRVMKARKIQIERFKRISRHGRRIFSNADMESQEIRQFCKIDERSAELMKMAITKLGLSARAYDRILKVARTIADCSSSESIRPEHISEAIQYRSLDRTFAF